MGGFNINSCVTGGLFVALLVVLCASPSGAETPAEVALEPIEAPGAPAAPTAAPPRPRAAASGLPLTRAEARQRIETMSPMRWLAEFGEVTIARERTTPPSR